MAHLRDQIFLAVIGVVLLVLQLVGLGDWVERNRVGIALVVVGFFVIWLLARVRELERLNTTRTRAEVLDVQEFLKTLRDYHLGRFPRLNEAHDSIDGARELAEILSIERPGLRRVLSFSMWMSRTFVRDVAGITDEELTELENQIFVTEERVWPTSSMTIEQWDTHTVVIDGRGHRTTIYSPEPWHMAMRPNVICRLPFGTSKGPSQRGTLEIVLWDDAIRCWAIEGRFKGRYWSGESEKEYLFITIPLKQDELNTFVRPDDDESVDTEYRYKSKPWDKQYEKEDENKGVGWSLHVLDNVAYAQR